MRRKIQSLLVFSLAALLAGCVATSGGTRTPSASYKKIEIVHHVPEESHGFVYQSIKAYPDPWGYSMRYKYKTSEWIHSDIYVYPVPAGTAGHTSEDITKEMAKQALEEIDLATEKGFYANNKVLGSKEFYLKGQYINRTELYVLRQNLETFSLLFITEVQGKLIKARVTMPDNPANRNSERWQRFVSDVFAAIIDNIDKA